MRLDRLDLTRYGIFTDFSIDFGPRQTAQPDLHIVYGPNEAGKSTMFAAYLDLLYGIRQTRYNFLHPDATLRIGGSLRIGDQTRQFVRIKRAANTLLDAHDQPIGETAIQAELGQIDREAYCAMFSLDDDSLEAGGKDILESRGDLGQLLFSASSGLADLSSRLAGVRAAADDFYRPRAHRPKLTQLKEQLAALRAERDAIDTLASRHAELVQTRDQRARQYQEALERRNATQLRLDQIRAFLAALPCLVRLRDIRARLAPLAALPEAPRGWADELPRLQNEDLTLGVRIETAAAQAAARLAERDAIVVDTVALQLAGRMAGLGTLRSRHETAELDIPRLRAEQQDAAQAMRELLRLLGREAEADPHRLLLEAPVVGRLREQIETRSGLDTGIRQAANELVAARQALDEAHANLREAGEEPGAASGRPAWAALAAALNAARAVDHAGRCRSAQRAHAGAAALLADQLAALLPWQGDAGALAAVAVPGADTIQRWKTGLAEQQRMLDAHAATIARLGAEIAELTAEQGAISDTTGVVTDEAAARLRAQREQAWAEHRRVLDAATAEAFEQALRRDDLAGEARMGHLAERDKLHRLAQSRAVREAAQVQATAQRDQAHAAQQALHAGIAAAIRALLPAPPEALTVPHLEDWIARRQAALAARQKAHEARQDLDAAIAEAAAARDSLAAALRAADVPIDATAGLETLVSEAAAAVDAEATLKHLRADVQKRTRELARRQQQADRSEAAAAAWQSAWATTCAGCWLGDGGATPALAAVRACLDELGKLSTLLDRTAGLDGRVRAMARDQASFTEAMQAIAAGLTPQPGADGVLAGGVLAGDGLTGGGLAGGALAGGVPAGGVPAGGVPAADGPAGGVLAGDVPAGGVQAGGVLALADAVSRRVHDAARDHKRRNEAEAALQHALAEQQALEDSRKLLEESKARMTGWFGVDSLQQVDRCLADLQRRAGLLRDQAATEAELLAAARLPDLAEAESVLATLDRAALEAEQIELQSRFTDEDEHAREQFSAYGQAKREVEAVGGDARVARIEEDRRTLLAEIEDGAMRYLRLRLGTAAMDQALRLYRDRHRSAMMQQASKAFQVISRGAYVGLSTQPRKDGEVLIAMSAGGGSKEADQLSKGTRFQLYLALRMAGYYEFARSSSAVPFISDDIMETFDDFRAEEAFRLFADMAEVGQVIYLTHHRHLCDIAQRVCPGARIHQLEASVRAAA